MRPQTLPHDPEWEYEYDENATEDYYVTLDLTSASLDERGATKSSTSRPKPVKSYSRAGGLQATASAASAGRLHVLDLHTDNPIVLFGKELYSCSWAETRGTQLYVARAGTAEKNIRPGHVLDFVASSRVQLVGQPAALIERNQQPTGASASEAILISEHVDDSNGHGDLNVDTPNDALQAGFETLQERSATPDQATTAPDVQAKASFFERLAVIKLQKGERTLIPSSDGANYQYRASKVDKDAVKKRSLAADARLPQSDPTGVPRARKRGPYKKRRLKSMSAVPGANDEAREEAHEEPQSWNPNHESIQYEDG